jgi:TolA-binding protein
MNKPFIWLISFPAIVCSLTAGDFNLAHAKEPQDLEKCIVEAKADDTGSNCLEELRGVYFRGNKYSEFVDLLRKLSPEDKAILPNLNYNIALSRYEQLKYLEEAKSWDEYFANGNDYRDDIVSEAEKAFKEASLGDVVRLYSRQLLYRFHKDQQDNFTEEALSNLMSSAIEYLEFNKDMAPIKDAADMLLFYGEKAKAKELYKIYAKELVSSDINDDGLKDAAFGFYKDGNLELSENIYDTYIERISKKMPKDKLTVELINIASLFAYKDAGYKDMPYAESIFKRIEDAGGLQAFDEELIYLRGFNLEKNKNYAQAKDAYLSLLQKYPESKLLDELTYKIGIISTYISRDLKTGREYFSKLDDNKSTLPYSQASLYQLGLLKQWEGDMASAKGYYMKLIEKSEGHTTDSLAMAKERLKEVEEGMAMEHNLKTFMDVALKEGSREFDMSKIELKSNIYQPKTGEAANIKSSVYLASSGCFNVELQYLWSGSLGEVKPDTKQSEFRTLYNNQGTKMVGLVLVSPTGITDYTFDLIDVR